MQYSGFIYGSSLQINSKKRLNKHRSSKDKETRNIIRQGKFPTRVREIHAGIVGE